MKNAFVGPINRTGHDWRIGGHEDITIETSTTKMQRKKKWKSWNVVSKNCVTVRKVVTYA